MELTQDKSYSISQASQALGKSEGTIKNYKKLVLEAFQEDLSLVVFGNGSLTELGFQQLSKAAHFIGKGERNGYIKAVFQAFPQLRFDIADSDQVSQATIRQDIATQVERLEMLFIHYGRAKVEQALAEIDLTVETLKSNALAEMRIASTSRPSSAQQGASTS